MADRAQGNMIEREGKNKQKSYYWNMGGRRNHVKNRNNVKRAQGFVKLENGTLVDLGLLQMVYALYPLYKITENMINTGFLALLQNMQL